MKSPSSVKPMQNDQMLSALGQAKRGPPGLK